MTSIVSLYAGGMTIRDIQHHMAAPMRIDISHETISAVTDVVLDELLVWQNRQLDEFYPVMFLDALRIKEGPSQIKMRPTATRRPDTLLLLNPASSRECDSSHRWTHSCLDYCGIIQRRSERA